MEIGSLSKPPTLSPATVQNRTDTGADAPRTELPPAQTVQPVRDVDKDRFDPSDRFEEKAAVDALMRQAIDRHMTVDRDSRELVFRAVNRETGEVVRQVPDESLLKLRMLARELEEKSQTPPPDHQVEKLA